MAELAIKVKLSVGKMTIEKATTQIRCVKIMVFVLTLPLIPLGILGAVISIKRAYDDEELARWEKNYLHYSTAIMFFTLAIALSITCTGLIIAMNKYFNRGLKREVSRIKVVFIVLTTSYLTRAIIFVPTHIKHFKDHHYLLVELTLSLGFIYWDVVPLTLIMIYHRI